MDAQEKPTKRILVAEDEPSIGAICRRVLTAEGLEVDIAPTGKAAQELLRNRSYDLMLLDFKMPEMDGKQLYTWIKQERPDMAKRIILTSGSVMGDETQTFVESTGRPFLPKPFGPGELIAAIRGALKSFED